MHVHALCMVKVVQDDDDVYEGCGGEGGGVTLGCAFARGESCNIFAK